MTPLEIETMARRKKNAVGDTFWSTAEIMDYIYAASMDLARESFCIERTYTTTTVAGTQEYALPSYCIAIKRVTYDGSKLQPINFREDDLLSFSNQATTAQGTAQYYALFNEVLYLRPIPDSAVTLKIFSINEPQSVSTTSTLEIPTQFHLSLVDYVVSEMYAKELNFQAATYSRELWNVHKKDAVRIMKKRKRGDGFASVQDDELSYITPLGAV